MELRQLQWFTILADELHYGRAAERIPVATSALSTAIKRLEQELGVVLVDRSRRSIALTPAGVELVEHAHVVLAAAQDAVAATQIAHHGAARHIRLGVFQNGASELNGPLLRAFRATLPDSQIEVVPLDFADHFTAVADGVVDLAIVRPPLDDHRIAVHPLYSEPLTVMMSRRHPMAEADSLTRADVIDERFIAAANEGVSLTWAGYWTYDDVRGEAPRVAGRTGNSVDAMISSIAEDDMSLLTTASSVARITLDPDVTHVPLDDPERRSLVAIATRHDQAPYIDSLVATARRITNELIGIVPSAEIEFDDGPARVAGAGDTTPLT